MEENPYQVPVVADVVAPLATDAVAVREAHIKHEASVKSLGILYYLGGIGLLFATAMAFAPLAEGDAGALGGQEMLILAGFGLLLVLQFMTGWGLRRLKPWARVTGSIFSVIGLIQIPVGTLIGAYCLYLFFSAKGGVVFSPAYQEIIAQTPEVKYRTSKLMKVLIAILLVLVGVILTGVYFSAPAPR